MAESRQPRSCEVRPAWQPGAGPGIGPQHGAVAAGLGIWLLSAEPRPLRLTQFLQLLQPSCFAVCSSRQPFMLGTRSQGSKWQSRASEVTPARQEAAPHIPPAGPRQKPIPFGLGRRHVVFVDSGSPFLIRDSLRAVVKISSVLSPQIRIAPHPGSVSWAWRHLPEDAVLMHQFSTASPSPGVNPSGSRGLEGRGGGPGSVSRLSVSART